MAQHNTCTATASVSSTKCSSSEWSCTVVQFSCTQAYVILLQQGQFALRSITSSDVHEQDWQRHPVDPYRTLLKVLTIHEGRNKLPVSRTQGAGRPGSSEVPRNPLTRWDVSSIPANGIFLTKKQKNKNKNAQRVEND